MTIDTSAILKEIDVVLEELSEYKKGSAWDDFSDKPESEAVMMTNRLASTIDRLSPKGSLHQKFLHTYLNLGENSWAQVLHLHGSLMALRREYELGYIQSVSELIHADTFSSFFEMAEHLVEQNYKDAAAVVAGSVLEQRLRELSLKNGLSTTHGGKWKKADALNAELAGAGVYSKLEQKSVTSWLGLRNEAAHGNYTSYDRKQVESMIQSITEFCTRNPA